MDVLILVALILLNGVFAMSEIALVTARKSRLQRLADEGDKRAASAIALGEEPTRFLSTVQIGITAIGLLNGIYGEAALADPLSIILQDMGIDAKTSSIASTAIVVIGITYLSIVVGELVPKRLAQINPEGIARLMARPISLLASLSRPFVFLLTLSTNVLLRLLGQGKTEHDNDSLTEEDIQAVLKEKSQNGIVEKQEHEMVRNVFHFDDRRVTSLMTPRNDVVALDLDQAINNNLNKLIASEHHCFPVTKGDLNNVQGVITTKQLLQYQISASHSDISQYITPPEFVPETWTGTQLLEYFRHTGIPMALVVDEYGDIQGIVTPKDILEALAGEFKTCNPDDVWSVENEDGSWSMDGLIPTQVLKDLLELKRLPDEDKGGYHTLSGMIMWCLGGMPTVDDNVVWEDWHFDVVKVEGNRIDRVTVRKLCDHSDSEVEDNQPQQQGQEEQQEDK